MSNDPKIKLKNSTTGMKYLSNVPVIITMVILALVISLVGYSIIKRGDKAKELNEEGTVTIVRSDPTQQIDSMSSIQKIKETKKLKSEKPELQKQKKQPSLLEQEQIRIEAERLRREQEAKRSPIKTAINNYTQSSSKKSTLEDLLASNQGKKVATVQPTYLQTHLNQKELSITEKNEKWIEQQGEKSFDYLKYNKTELLSQYEIKTGTLIPGVMISGINSELPGSILGQVRENVYDTATGNYLLIPQGTKIVGKYNSDVQYGQSRALVIWQRLIFPSGKTLNIENMEGQDQAGYSGFADQVDNHYFRLFGSALLISIISGELSFSDGKISVNQKSGSDGASSTTVSQTAEKLIEKNLAIAPTIKIRPGYKFNIFVQKDMILEALQ